MEEAVAQVEGLSFTILEAMFKELSHNKVDFGKDITTFQVD
jgi:hypothetical protein